jgi:hypothetical protein
MWLPDDARYTSMITDQYAVFFLQLWHSMVHRSATDSFRMRCMNSLNILEELYDLIQKQKEGLPDEFDIKLVAQEAKSILSADSVMKNHFGQQMGLLEPLLDQVASGDVHGDKKKHLLPVYSRLSYFLRDSCATLKNGYRTKLIDTLRGALFDEKSIDQVFEHTRILLSVLIHEGHSIESLFSLLQSVFLHRDDRTFLFQRNFDFSRRILETPEKAYEVILRMEGFTHEPPQDIAGFEFSRAYKVGDVDERGRAVLSPGLNVIFAKTKVAGRDDRSAGMRARKKLDDILDLIRFELEMDVITVRPDCVSIGLDSGKARVYPLPSQIPNPKRNVSSEEFMDFVGRIGDVIENPSLDSQSKEKVRSAFHFYRIGRDAEQFENKFLNWWTALEYLVRTGEGGSIMPEIEKRLVPILILGYSNKHLRSYAKALYFCRVRPSAGVADRFHVADYKDLNPLDLFILLKDDNEFRRIEDNLSRYPLLAFYLRAFRKQMRDAGTIKEFYDQHEKRIRWHINRIYRIRCDIVHSAEYSMNLTLLGANLEYYLKYVLTSILEIFTDNKAIASLTELYDRVGFTFECLQSDLAVNRTDFHDRLLKDGEHRTLPCV